MKKFSFIALCFLGISAIAVSCSGNSNSEKQREDSIRDADSIAAVEAAQADALKAEQQAQLDSLRQDSIAKGESDDFFNSLPDPKKIVWDMKAGKYLKSLGFEGSTKIINADEEESEGTYTLTKGDRSCKVHFTTEFHEGVTKVTITGDDEALSKFYKKASKMKATYEEGGTTVEKKGNTVIIDSFGA